MASKRAGRPEKPPRPDHFIGIRIREPRALGDIRSQIVKRSPAIAGYLEEVARSHVTLGVLRLDTPEKVARCAAHFKRAVTKLRARDLCPEEGFRIAFDSLDMFGNRVLFLKPTETSIARLMELRSMVFDEYVSEFDVECRREYNPYLTIAKQTPWVSKRRKGSVPPRMPDDTKPFDGIEVTFDTHVFTVELLQMRGEKEGDGCYKIVASERLGEKGLDAVEPLGVSGLDLPKL